MGWFSKKIPPSLRKRVDGSIGYHGLEDWWFSALDDEERKHIEDVFAPLGFGKGSLTKGKIDSTSETAVGLLSGLAGWFNNSEDRALAHKILVKAEELSPKDAPINRHFLYQQMIEVYYKDRDEEEFMAKAEDACRKQIALAPEVAACFKSRSPKSPLPSHKGYQQLAIILEKNRRIREAIEVARQALSQGWSGGWEKRIERYEKMLEKKL